MFPVNFIVGAAVGAAATYIYKDENAQNWLKNTGNKLKEGAGSFSQSFKKKSDEESAESAETVKDLTDETTEVEATAEVIEEKVAETVDVAKEEIAEPADKK